MEPFGISSTNEVQNLWGAVYAAVNAINLFLEGLEDKLGAVVILTGMITQAEYNQLRVKHLTLTGNVLF